MVCANCLKRGAAVRKMVDAIMARDMDAYEAAKKEVTDLSKEDLDRLSILLRTFFHDKFTRGNP